MSGTTTKLIKFVFRVVFSVQVLGLSSPRFRALPTTSGGLAKRRLTLNVLRATSVRIRTTLSAGLLPPLRQTARCVAGISLIL